MSDPGPRPTPGHPPPRPAIRPWRPPDPPVPATPGRLSAMARSILLVARGPESARPWAAEIEGEMVRAVGRLTREDREWLQGELDRLVDGLNGPDGSDPENQG